MPIERSFSLPGLTLAAQEWGSPNGLPVLAVHGWLDNSGSFDLLAPLLAGCRCIAIDAAGQGRSDFRSADADYSLAQDVADLLALAEALGWPAFRLIGHSRGAAVASLFASAFPERVEQLVLIEGGVPTVDAASDAPQALAGSLRERRMLAGRGGRVFATREAAIAERAGGFSPVSLGAAEILARRALVEVDGGFSWRVDQRLKARSRRFTIEQVMAFVQGIRAPVLMVLAEQSPFSGRSLYREALTWFANLEVVTLPGRHHLHLEGAEKDIAARILGFFGLPAD